MADKYAVIRTDLMYGTDNRAGLVSLRFYDDKGNVAEVENGTIVKLKGFEDGQREVYKAVAAQSGDNLDECAIVAAPEVMYDERLHNLDEFISEAGTAVRGYVPHARDLFSVTAEGFVDGKVPEVGGNVGIGTNGKLDASGSGFGACTEIDVGGRYTYYCIEVGKTASAG
jgi:hypothetical protein